MEKDGDDGKYTSFYGRHFYNLTWKLFRGGSVAVNDEKPDTEKERRRVLGKLNGNEGADVASGG